MNPTQLHHHRLYRPRPPSPLHGVMGALLVLMSTQARADNDEALQAWSAGRQHEAGVLAQQVLELPVQALRKRTIRAMPGSWFPRARVSKPSVRVRQPALVSWRHSKPKAD